jgi:translocation and assembly module TamB
MRRLLFLPLLALPLAAQAQQDDRSYLTALLEDNLSSPGRKVTITGFQGALSSRATIDQLTIADTDGIWLTLNEVVLDWNRASLLRGAFSVNALTAEEIVLARPPLPAESTLPHPEASGFALPELPVSVEIGQLAANRIELGEAVLGQPLEGRLEAGLSLVGGDGQTNLVLERTDAGPAGRLALDAAYANSTGILKVDLAAREEADGIAATLLGLPGAPSAELLIKGEGPLAGFAADVTLATDDTKRLAGQVILQQAADGAQGFGVDLGGDLAPLFLPDYAAFFGPEVRLQAAGQRATDGRLSVDRLELSTRALALTGDLALAADGLPERFALQGKLGVSGGPVLLPLTGPRTEVDGADLSLRFDAAEGDGWRLAAALRGLRRPDMAIEAMQITGAGRIARATTAGGANVDGTISFTTTGLAPADPALAQALGTVLGGTLRFLWQEGNDGLRIEQLSAGGDGYGLTGEGRLQGLGTALALSGSIEARVDDLSRAAALAGRDLGGSTRASLSGNAALLAGSFALTGRVEGQDLRMGQTEADALLRGASTIDLSVTRDETGTTLRQLDLVAGSLTAQAEGNIATAGSRLTADLDFADLSVLGADYRGQLAARASFAGTPQDGRLTLEGTGNGLGIGQPQADALLRGPSQVALSARVLGEVVQIDSLTLAASNLRATAQGKLGVSDSDLTADLAFTDLSALGDGYRGALSARATFRGTADNARMSLDGTGRNLGLGQTDTDRLLAGESRLSAELRLADGLLRVDRANLSNPQLTASATGTVAGAARQVQLDARLTNLALLLPEFPGPVTLSGTAREDGRRYQLDLAGRGPGQIDATLRGSLAADFRTADLALAGTAQAGLANAFLSPRSVNGPLRFDLRLNGPLRLQSASGRITLSQARLADPGLPFTLDTVQATADLAGGRMRVDSSAAISTGGTLRMAGSLGLAAPFDGDLSVSLLNARFRDPQLYSTRVNGTVTLRGPLAGGATIGGDISLLETELQVPSTGFGGTGGLEPLLHLNEPADVHATRARAGLTGGGAGAGSGPSLRPYPLNLRISAPNQIFIRGRGLDAELGGEVVLRGTTANIAPSGAFNLIRGRLDILGERLLLAEAQALLEGDLIPDLRILASTESDGITASVLIEGPANAPEVSFVSVPELPQEEVLARLLFRRELTSLSAFQAAQLASAVATLAGRGGVGVIGKLRQGFGLDDLDLVTEADGGTSVRAGKYISRNVYTEVMVDDAGETEINLNLDLTDSITVRGSTASDGETGIGIFIEKDY